MNQGILGWEDRDIFFNPDHFAIPVQLVKAGATHNLDGIVDVEGEDLAIGNVLINSEKITLYLKIDSVTEKIVKGDIIQIPIGANGEQIERFAATEAIKNDGSGIGLVHLLRESSQAATETQLINQYKKNAIPSPNWSR